MRLREESVRSAAGEVFDGPFVLADWLQGGERPERAYVRYLGACRRFREKAT